MLELNSDDSFSENISFTSGGFILISTSLADYDPRGDTYTVSFVDYKVREYDANGYNVIRGTSGDDNLTGTDENDKILGYAGDDYLEGGAGADTMVGGSGADKYYVDNVNDIVTETDNTPEGTSGFKLDLDVGSTIDKVISSVSYSLTNYVENLTLSGGKDRNATGNDLDNELTGNKGNITLKGNSGNDILAGENGSDTLVGGNGKDKLIGSKGRDVLMGGKGSDKFKILDPSHNKDTITDFKRTQKDKIQVVSKNFKKLAKGKLASKYFVSNKFGIAKDKNDYFVFKIKNKTLYFDKDGSGSGSGVAIAKIGNGINLKNTDIVVV